MVALRKTALVCSVSLSFLISCDPNQPLDPSVQPSFRVTDAPSGTKAAAASESRISVTWQDNSTSESGFEVHRSTTGANGTFALLATTGAGVTSYSDDGLTPSTEYCYEVRTVRTTGRRTTFSDFSPAACATTPAPAAPSGTDATPLNSATVQVRWIDNSTTEEGFRVERSGDGGSTWTTAGTPGPNATAFTDFGRTLEQAVCYHVFAVHSRGDSPPSNTDCTAPPAAPTDLRATGVDGPAIDLAWMDKSSVEDGYEVQRSRDGVAFSPLADLPANSASYRDTRVTLNTTYWYEVRAKRDGGFSDFSNAATGVAVDAPPIPPSGTQAVPGASDPYSVVAYYNPVVNRAVTVHWADHSVNEAGFRVSRSTDGGASWVDVGTTGPNANYVTDAGRTPEQEACYRVFAFNSKGESSPSEVDCTTPPAGPTDLGVGSADNYQTVDLGWTDNSGVEDGYEVWVSVCIDYVGNPCGFRIATLPSNTTSYHDSQYASGCYYYYVAAVKDGGYSDWSSNYYAPDPACYSPEGSSSVSTLQTPPGIGPAAPVRRSALRVRRPSQ